MISEFTGLTTLPESLGHLKSLFHIDLSGCSRLAALPESFGDLINLTHVNLSRCHGLAELSEPLQKLRKLVYLDLSFCSCFEGIGEGLRRLTNLEHLNLSNPCCYVAQHHSHLQGLKDGLCKLTKLRYLNLSMCLNPIFYCHKSQEDSLKYLQECVSGLSRLEHLDLSHNTFLFDLPESLGNISRLHTLDLLGCIRIKKVGETKCLKIIIDLSKCRGLESCQLVVRVDEVACSNTSSLAQLEVVDCKELEISCLERLKSLDEARRIRLVEKQKVERLKLCWTVGAAQGSMQVEENALLGELVPPHSLQCLQICGYGGETCLPAWRIPSISYHLRNLTEVTMEDFSRCIVLPPLGLFPNLQRLVLRRMARITRIDAGELSGGNKEAFTRLSKFTIDDMENLKEFEFAAVDELAIQKCPLLSCGSLPPRAQRLLISDCEQLMSSSVGGIDGVEGPSAPVTELVVQTCNLALGDWSLLHHLPGLCSLTINNCYNLTSSPEIISALSSLQSLCFYQCHEPMESLPVFLCDLTSLQQLAIDECHGVQSLPEDMLAKLTSLEALYIWDCPELKEWCESEENKQKLAHILIKFEKFGTSKTGVHPPEM